MIQVRIQKQFAPDVDSPAFSLHVDFAASAGITVLFGPGGSGKTLTLDAIAGFVRPDQGRILLDDDILFDGAAKVHLPSQSRNCGYVFHNYALFPHMTLRQNLSFAAERRPRLERHRKVNEMIEAFHLAEVAARLPGEVPRSQKQRCAIARALIGTPRLLLLDEPARGLDAFSKAELSSLLRRVRTDFGAQVLLATDDLDGCFETGDEMLVYQNGRLIQTGSPRKVFEAPASIEVARMLGKFNLLPAEIRALDPARNYSRVRYETFDLTGPYFPGHLLGDKVWLCVRREQIRARGRDGKPGPNQIPVQLLRVVDSPGALRLEFAGEITAEMTHAEYEKQKHNKEWLIEFPAEVLRVL